MTESGEAVHGRTVLRLIGYWDDPSDPGQWPDVRDFVARNPVDPDQRDALVTYLRSGTVFVAGAGFSTCRICGRANGSTELTDRRHFIWPVGLVHYVEHHAVQLPDEVLAVAASGPAPPVNPRQIENDLRRAGDVTIDEQWWRELGRPPTG